MVEHLAFAWDGKTVRIGLERQGSGPTLLLLPALSSISTRGEMRPLQERLSSSHATVAVDWPGFGQEPRPAVAWQPETYRAFLKHVLAHVVRAPFATVAAGHGAGYLLAQGAEAPGSAGHLCLIAPTWRGPLPTMVNGKRPAFRWLARAVDVPLLGQAFYRLNVSNYWYPSHRQSNALSLLLAAQPIAFILGAPLSGAIMDGFADVGGMHGWQWMYILEAAPSVVLGLAVFFYLTNGVDDAKWLAQEEKVLLKSNLEGESHHKSDYPLTKLFSIGMMWVFTTIYLCIVIGVYGISFWLPSIIKATGVKSILMVGLITAIPYALSVAIMLVVTRNAERTNEKRWHASLAAMLGGLGLILNASFSDSTVLTVLFITVANAGSLIAMALFWSFPGSILTGAAVAAGIAAINSVGNLGGFLGPFLLGWLTERLGNSNWGLGALGGVMIFAGVLIATTCRAYGLRREGQQGSPALAAVH